MDSIAQKDKMLPNNTVLRIDQTNSGVSANCEGGSFCNGGVVVGCDGVNSKASTRSEMCRLSSEKDCGRLSSDGGDKADLKKFALKNAWRPVSEILALGDLWKACEIHVGAVG
ncbi:hypothetical protein NUH16_004640 [Penicillium rubens]|nr:uncharacterized protein N7525_011115 [Penicillium rubens]KAJ5036761.1 hypothetical protein NUH16_004640 [Penicillium rubens]KAJ5821831.1 hypothetical protein N7525_011115 [Penicillium rubens]KAJ5859477.1 hypothetical protein N7534_004754 [Penicillium rubens]